MKVTILCEGRINKGPERELCHLYQQRIKLISTRVAALFSKKKVKKGNSIMQKALKQNKAKKAKAKRNVTPPKAKPKAQMKRNSKLH